jgi:hypothetical protein
MIFQSRGDYVDCLIKSINIFLVDFVRYNTIICHSSCNVFIIWRHREVFNCSSHICKVVIRIPVLPPLHQNSLRASRIKAARLSSKDHVIYRHLVPMVQGFHCRLCWRSEVVPDENATCRITCGYQQQLLVSSDASEIAPVWIHFVSVIDIRLEPAKKSIFNPYLYRFCVLISSILKLYA